MSSDMNTPIVGHLVYKLIGSLQDDVDLDLEVSGSGFG